MIYRQNWLDVQAYLHYLDRVKQLDTNTIKRIRGHLRHLLEWADETPLPKARYIDPTFPTYLLSAREDGKAKPLASASVIKCLAFTRQFLTFAHREWTRRYKTISESWVELLRPPRHLRSGTSLVDHAYYTLEDCLKIAAVSTETLREERGKVAVCMLFLSGMRADALASTPISCVDIQERAIHQLPNQGVRTKNRKAAITYLLYIPPLLEVVTRWDQRVKAFSPRTLWYSTLSNDGMKLTATEVAAVGRTSTIEDDVRLICERANLHYQPPHKLRHGHIMYARSLARTPEEIKAVSQNAMHANSIITDQVYGKLTGNNVRNLIANLKLPEDKPDKAEILRLIELLTQQLT